MSRISHLVWVAMMSLLLATNLTSVTAAKTPQSKPEQSSTVSSQDKAKACNDAADKKSLKGQDRKNFMQDCLSKAGNEQLNQMSQKDKMDVCKDLADKRNLAGSDRRSFIKDCMNKANPK